MKSRTGRDSASASKKKPASNNDEGGQIVELSRFRADLGRGRRLRRADALLEAESPRQAVRGLPGDEFYYVLHELGFPEASEILHYGTPEQVQIALDFALWDRDRLAPERVDEWLGHLTEAPPHVLAAWARGLDVELLALLLRQRARIHDLTQGEEVDHVDGGLFNTPDGFFAIELLGDHEQQRVTRLLVDRLYRMDRDWMRRILVGTRAEMDAELEEEAYRWRSGRMADLGFEDYYDALEVYRELDPASVRPGETAVPRVRPLGDEVDAPFLRLPVHLAERLATSSPFARAVGGITDKDELTNLQAALVTLSNRVLAADRITPGDDAAVETTLARLAATLDLAVEFLGRHTLADAVQAVRTVPLVRLFQLGVSLIGKLRRLALTLRSKTPFARLAPPIDLFELEDREVLAACARLRPLFPRALETPAAVGERPFASLADLGLATVALERAAAALALAVALGATPDEVAKLAAQSDEKTPELDAGLLGRTQLLRRLFSETGPGLHLPAPRAAELEPLLQKARTDAAARSELAAKLVRAVPPAAVSTAAGPAAAAVLQRWIEEIFAGAPLLLGGAGSANSL